MAGVFMQSMTGYGKAEYAKNGIALTVELKTVNNRFLDIIPKYPRAFIGLDDAIRKTIQSKIKRGRVELFITYLNTSEGSKKLVIDEGLCSEYVSTAKILSEKYGLTNDLTVMSLLRAPDCVNEEVSDENSEKVEEALINTLSTALDNLIKMRKIEGEKLKNDILSRDDEVERLVGEISKRAPLIKAEYEEKIKERMAEILNSIDYDQSRMLQEVAIFADRTNIDEELTRLKSHIAQLRNICREDIDTGKKLDFLMQEFNREANTVCSKSNDIEITKNALALKNEIEKIREQVQNIE